jgi:hypothetical protein
VRQIRIVTHGTKSHNGAALEVSVSGELAAPSRGPNPGPCSGGRALLAQVRLSCWWAAVMRALVRARQRHAGALAAYLFLGRDKDAREMPAPGAFVCNEPLLVQRRDDARELVHLGLVALCTGRWMGERGIGHSY